MHSCCVIYRTLLLWFLTKFPWNKLFRWFTKKSISRNILNVKIAEIYSHPHPHHQFFAKISWKQLIYCCRIIFNVSVISRKNGNITSLLSGLMFISRKNIQFNRQLILLQYKLKILSSFSNPVISSTNQLVVVFWNGAYKEIRRLLL